MSEYSGGGAIFGATGGVMEAAVRTAYHFITNEAPPPLLYDLEPIRGLQGIKSAELDIPGVGKVRIAVVSGMANARQLLQRIKDGTELFHFVEFMACPGGCISGGGQPKSSLPPSDQDRMARSEAIYSIDEQLTLRLSHENPELRTMYARHFNDEPNGSIAHDLLHIHDGEYRDRSMNLAAKRSG
jgi:iron only hydrogenase large subunit-like protein